MPRADLKETEATSPPQRGFVRRLVRRLVRLYYPKIEIRGSNLIPSTGPVILCGNHPNSLLDPVVIGIAAGRPVRFLAKAPLFEIPIFGRTMAALGMIPAFRGSDDRRQVRRNLESIGAAAKVLLAGDAMGIFPEGKSTDRMVLEAIRSGTARIALQALDEGVEGLRVIPLALHYEQKEAFRSQVWVVPADPIEMDAWKQRRAEEPRKAVRELTREIEAGLKSVMLHLDEPDWEYLLDEIESLIDVEDDTPLYDRRKRVADAMNRALTSSRDRAESKRAEIDAWKMLLENNGLDCRDHLLTRQGPELLALLLIRTLSLILLLPLCIIGTAAHILPFLLVRAIARWARPPGRSAVALWRLLIGLPVYGLWYAALTVLALRLGVAMGLVAGVLAAMPALGILTLQSLPGLARTLRRLPVRAKLLLSRKQLDSLRSQRMALQKSLLQLASEYGAERA